MPGNKRFDRGWLGPVLGVAIFSVAIWVLHRELAAHHIREIMEELGKIPNRRIAGAIFLTVIGYTIMTGYDFLALRFIRHPIAYRKIALASFTGYAFSNNIGFSMIAGASVRYRLYSSWGISAIGITQIVFFCTLTLWLGFFALGAFMFVLFPVPLQPHLLIPFNTTFPLGILMGLVVAGYLTFNFITKGRFHIRSWELTLPPVRTFGLQLLVSSLDWFLAGCVLYQLLPVSELFSLPECVGIFLIAQLAGLVSQVPGGIGVFETVFILLLSGRMPVPSLMGSLLAFRVIYYLIPLGAAALLLGVHEISLQKKWLRQVAELYHRWGNTMLPLVLSFSTFVAGTILLFSGATPAIDQRLSLLKKILPLPLLEISHFMGSTIGIGLLLLARGLQRRLDGAYWVTMILLSLGIAASLLKGLDFEEAAVLLVVLAALIPSREAFYRKASLLTQRFTPAWITAIATALLCSVWLGLFSHKHVEYANNLWWRFTFSGSAPRFLRATAGAAGVLLIFAMARLMRPSTPKLGSTRPNEWDDVARIVQSASAVSSHLALLGDKSFLFSAARNAFIMYGVEGRSWVSMGDPVGPQEEWTELIWRFRELSDRFGGWTVFYQVGPEYLHPYLDLGLTLTKLGETARVKLDTFTLDGSSHKSLRQQTHKLEKEGYFLEIMPPEKTAADMHRLKEISEAWLSGKKAREKGFSLGFFNEPYLSRLPMAVVQKEGAIVAFANMWQGSDRTEISIDLMRYHPVTAPKGVMDFLFVQSLLWAKANGYQYFDLGMAPLSGIESRALAPLWNRLATLIARYGEQFYNFQGLRQYKEKFNPEWQPKYLASPGGLALPYLLTHLVALISNSPRKTAGPDSQQT
jgi:phosphatidylglycerol lysyltransferase